MAATLSIRIVGVVAYFFNEAGNLAKAHQVIRSSQNRNEVIGNAFAYQDEYEISGEVDITLPDGMTTTVPVKEMCTYGKKIYRHGEVWSEERILQMPDGDSKNGLLQMMKKHQCKHIAILVIDNKRRAFPFFEDRDILDVPDLEIQACETTGK